MPCALQTRTLTGGYTVLSGVTVRGRLHNWQALAPQRTLCHQPGLLHWIYRRLSACVRVSPAARAYVNKLRQVRQVLGRTLPAAEWAGAGPGLVDNTTHTDVLSHTLAHRPLAPLVLGLTAADRLAFRRRRRFMCELDHRRCRSERVEAPPEGDGAN